MYVCLFFSIFFPSEIPILFFYIQLDKKSNHSYKRLSFEKIEFISFTCLYSNGFVSSGDTDSCSKKRNVNTKTNRIASPVLIS